MKVLRRLHQIRVGASSRGGVSSTLVDVDGVALDETVSRCGYLVEVKFNFVIVVRRLNVVDQCIVQVNSDLSFQYCTSVI